MTHWERGRLGDNIPTFSSGSALSGDSDYVSHTAAAGRGNRSNQSIRSGVPHVGRRIVSKQCPQSRGLSVVIELAQLEKQVSGTGFTTIAMVQLTWNWPMEVSMKHTPYMDSFAVSPA